MFKCRDSIMLILDYHDFLDFGFRPYICFMLWFVIIKRGKLLVLRSIFIRSRAILEIERSELETTKYHVFAVTNQVYV